MPTPGAGTHVGGRHPRRWPEAVPVTDPPAELPGRGPYRPLLPGLVVPLPV
jgi:hypothetical protein